MLFRQSCFHGKKFLSWASGNGFGTNVKLTFTWTLMLIFPQCILRVDILKIFSCARFGMQKAIVVLLADSMKVLRRNSPFADLVVVPLAVP